MKPTGKRLVDIKLASAVLDSVAVLVIVLDQEGRVVYFNQACEKLSGYSLDEVKGLYPWLQGSD